MCSAAEALINMESRNLGLKEKILISVVKAVGGNCDRTMTMEDIVVWSWRDEPKTWGLRGYEPDYPDSDKVTKEMRSRGRGLKSMLALGWLERTGRHLFKLTPAGLAASSTFRGHSGEI